MKAQGALAYGALAAVGLVAAYVTWQRGPEQKDKGDVVVLDLSRKQVQKIRYEDGKRWVELVRGPGDEGVWVTELQKPAPPPPPDPHAGLNIPGLTGADAGTPTVAKVGTADGGTQLASAQAPAIAPEPPPTAKKLRGNEQAEKAFDNFAPLMATRQLGKLDEKKLLELGLTQSQRTVKVTASAGEQEFTVTYPPSGVGSAYFQAKKDGALYLVRGQTLGDLEFAGTRLVDRRFHTFKPEEFDTVQLASGGEIRRFSHAAGKLTNEGSGQLDDFARNWHDRVWRFIPNELYGQGETPKGGEPSVVFRLEYSAQGRALGFLDVAKLEESFFVRSEHTAGWVRVHAGSGDLLGEAKKVAEGS